MYEETIKKNTDELIEIQVDDQGETHKKNTFNYSPSKSSLKQSKLLSKLDPEMLMRRTYSASESFPKVFTFGTVGMMENSNVVQFRVFREDDMLIQSRFQSKLQNQMMDEDCATQPSQLAFAERQNRSDLIHAVYVHEKHREPQTESVSQMEHSLFFKQEPTFYSQQYATTTQGSSIQYYTQPREQMTDESSYSI